MSKLAWPTPAHSRNEVNRCGKYLVEVSDIDVDEYLHAISVVDNWRAAHLYPLNTFQATLRSKARKVNRNIIVAQRLKRLPSILSKLSLNPSMQLARMQDIVGLRAVVANKDMANQLINNYKSTKFDHKLKSEYDYISNPKQSGYRSHHLVYRYASSARPEYDGMLIELQIRTKIQHSWAMAVETMGVYLNSSLKSGLGPEEWKEFFSLASAAFAIKEEQPIHSDLSTLSNDDIIYKLKVATHNIRAIDHLNALTGITENIRNETARSYYVIDLDLSLKMIRLYSYARDDLTSATKQYSKLEKETQNDPDRNVVLVSAGSVANLKKAYPSYFLDTDEFVKTLRGILG